MEWIDFISLSGLPTMPKTRHPSPLSTTVVMPASSPTSVAISSGFIAAILIGGWFYVFGIKLQSMHSLL